VLSNFGSFALADDRACMPVRESEAIILRTYPLGEGDRLVSFFCRSEGRLRGVARGARKPKSRFGASLEPLSHIRIWFYERETRELVRISQCDLIESYWDAQRSYNVSLAFGFLAEVAEGALPEKEPSDPVFRLLLATCRTIAQTGLIALPISYFAIWMLRLGGWLPSLERCSICRRELGGQQAWAAGDWSEIFCQECKPVSAVRISAESLSAARSMLRESLEAMARKGLTQVPMELTNYLMDLIERHMERKSMVRSTLELVP
jgi:DNA repair protein RecO (recombination protein O)